MGTVWVSYGGQKENPLKIKGFLANHSHFDTNATFWRECCIFGELVQQFVSTIFECPAALYDYAKTSRGVVIPRPVF